MIFTVKINVTILSYSCKPSPVVGIGRPKLFRAVVDFYQRVFHDTNFFFEQIVSILIFPPL